MTEIQRWEYKYETLSGGAFKAPKEEEIETYLNELGEQGWEVFEIIQQPSSTKITFAAKRRVTGRSRRQHKFQEVTW